MGLPMHPPRCGGGGYASDPAFDRRRELVGLVFKEVERVISYGLPGWAYGVPSYSCLGVSS